MSDREQKLLAACEWILNVMNRDGGDAWCAVRSQPGAKAWVIEMRETVGRKHAFQSVQEPRVTNSIHQHAKDWPPL